MRRILIIPKGTLQDHRSLAEAEGIGEIVEGIPSRLRGKVSPEDLPLVWEEPPAPEPKPEPPDNRELADMLESIKANLEATRIELAAAQAELAATKQRVTALEQP